MSSEWNNGLKQKFNIKCLMDSGIFIVTCILFIAFAKFNNEVVCLKVRELAAKFSLQNILQNTNARKIFFQVICFSCGFIASGMRKNPLRRWRILLTTRTF